MSERARFSRQLALVEIGVEGQRAIGRATAHVGAEPLATRYAERAGFAAVVSDAPSAVVPVWVATPAAREVVAASLSALRALRVAIGREPDPTPR